MNRSSNRAFFLENPVYIKSYASIAGKKEGEGPLGEYFDCIEEDSHFGEDSWEKAESRMQGNTFSLALEKSGLKVENLTAVFAGDLNNQCIGSAYAMRDTGTGYIGLYGACSNMAEGLLLSSLVLNSPMVKNTAVVTSSHFGTAEKQFRYPLSYGGQRTMSAQWTCTASGSAILSSEKSDTPKITGCCVGKICDLGVTDLSNMGAAMAPAAADTISHFLLTTKSQPNDFDAIITGDLGYVGSELLYDLLQRQNIDISSVHMDCGKLIFDKDTQDTHSGG
ncbi:MAG: stage V sporulation protein AD, partial [Ruminococcus callidus]|nr:stage V sporulation protein AD [Ruminococcus callidus]